jgi:azobenzene reductase
MRITVVSGSMRNNSQSLNVAKHLVRVIEGLGAQAELLDLNISILPLYNHDLSDDTRKIWDSIEEGFKISDGFVLVSPEWDGMFSAGLHNLFNYVASASKNNTMAHKPVSLVGVSSGMGGAYPIAQLRMTGPKNTHYVVIPENLRFAKVKEVLIDGEIVVEGLRDRVYYAMKMLLEYAEALGQIRNNGTIDYEHFSSGV